MLSLLFLLSGFSDLVLSQELHDTEQSTAGGRSRIRHVSTCTFFCGQLQTRRGRLNPLNSQKCLQQRRKKVNRVLSVTCRPNTWEKGYQKCEFSEPFPAFQFNMLERRFSKKKSFSRPCSCFPTEKEHLAISPVATRTTNSPSLLLSQIHLSLLAYVARGAIYLS